MLKSTTGWKRCRYKLRRPRVQTRSTIHLNQILPTRKTNIDSLLNHIQSTRYHYHIENFCHGPDLRSSHHVCRSFLPDGVYYFSANHATSPRNVWHYRFAHVARQPCPPHARRACRPQVRSGNNDIGRPQGSSFRRFCRRSRCSYEEAGLQG